MKCIDHSALLCHNARALTNQIARYILLILLVNKTRGEVRRFLLTNIHRA